MLRVTLFALVFLGLNAAAIARCCVALPYDQASSEAAAHETHSSGTDGLQSDCGSDKDHKCGAVVQMPAPESAALAAPPQKTADVSIKSPIALSINRRPVAIGLRQHPPDRASTYKAFYAKTGRLLV